MRFAFFKQDGDTGVAVQGKTGWLRVADLNLPFPVTVDNAASLDPVQQQVLAQAISDGAVAPMDLSDVSLLPPISPAARIFCIGLNYLDHAQESKMEKPAYPVVFLRTYDSFVGHRTPLIKPRLSELFDYEGEMVAILRRGGRYIAQEDAASYVGAYTVANDGSVRDFQLRKGTQWTMGKNFNSSGAIGPHLVTAEELPSMGKGLSIVTRLNGKVVQEANTNDMIFDIAQIIAYISQAFLLKPGDVIVSGTPAGVGAARNPQLFMQAGDTVEVEVQQIGCLSNEIMSESDIQGDIAA